MVILHIGVLEHGTPMYQSAQTKEREREEGQRRRSRREGNRTKKFQVLTMEHGIIYLAS